MYYPGGKGKTYQQIINLLPPHDVYIETHLGGGAVMRKKRPARVSIGVESDENVLAAWRAAPLPQVELVHGRAEDFLSSYRFTGQELIYADPPYVPDLRRRARIYRHEYDHHDHLRLIHLLSRLRCKVIISGYQGDLYDSVLGNWNKRSFPAQSQGGRREEVVWFNYEFPRELHDARYLGDTFRERQAVQRRMDSLKAKIIDMDPRERAMFGEWFRENYWNKS